MHFKSGMVKMEQKRGLAIQMDRSDHITKWYSALVPRLSMLYFREWFERLLWRFYYSFPVNCRDCDGVTVTEINSN